MSKVSKIPTRKETPAMECYLPNGESALDFLQRLIDEMPPEEKQKAMVAGFREAMRLALSHLLYELRQEKPYTRKEIADEMGVTSKKVTQVESPNTNHFIEDLVSYLSVFGKEIQITVIDKETGNVEWVIETDEVTAKKVHCH